MSGKGLVDAYLNIYEADMTGAPSIKNAKPEKKTNVKYDPHMKVMAPQVKGVKEDLEASGKFSEKEIEAILEALEGVEEGYDEPKMHSAVKRVMGTQPAAKGRAASRLHSKYSMRSKGNVAGETDGPGPNAPKRSGRKGRGAETDRGSGNAAKRRMGK